MLLSSNPVVHVIMSPLILKGRVLLVLAHVHGYRLYSSLRRKYLLVRITILLLMGNILGVHQLMSLSLRV